MSSSREDFKTLYGMSSAVLVGPSVWSQHYLQREGPVPAVFACTSKQLRVPHYHNTTNTATNFLLHNSSDYANSYTRKQT